MAATKLVSPWIRTNFGREGGKGDQGWLWRGSMMFFYSFLFFSFLSFLFFLSFLSFSFFFTFLFFPFPFFLFFPFLPFLPFPSLSFPFLLFFLLFRFPSLSFPFFSFLYFSFLFLSPWNAAREVREIGNGVRGVCYKQTPQYRACLSHTHGDCATSWGQKQCLAVLFSASRA